jgi:Lon protease-like protein
VPGAAREPSIDESKIALIPMLRPLRLFPLDAVLFPGATIELHVFEPRYVRLVEEALESGDPFGIVLIARGKEVGDPTVVPREIGSLAEITGVESLPMQRYHVSARGYARFRILEIRAREPYVTAEVETLDERSAVDPSEAMELGAAVRDLFSDYTAIVRELLERSETPALPDDGMRLSFTVADGLLVATEVKQRLLELDDWGERLRFEHALLREQTPRLREMLEQARGLRARRRATSAVFGRYFSPN